MSAENPNGEHKLWGMYTGVVIDDVDKRKLAQVRVRIPGLTDDVGWCLPMGSPGGGGMRRGFKSVPRVNAEVNIFFKQGDPDHPYYLPGNWGHPPNKGIEAPGGGLAPPLGDDLNVEGDEISAEEARWIDVYETESFIISIDERAHFADETTRGKGSFYFRHKLSGNTIEYDGTSNAIITSSELMTLNVTGLLAIDAGQLQLNGRFVRTTTDPI